MIFLNKCLIIVFIIYFFYVFYKLNNYKVLLNNYENKIIEIKKEINTKNSKNYFITLNGENVPNIFLRDKLREEYGKKGMYNIFFDPYHVRDMKFETINLNDNDLK